MKIDGKYIWLEDKMEKLMSTNSHDIEDEILLWDEKWVSRLSNLP